MQAHQDTRLLTIPATPPAPKSEQIDILHGVAVADPFRPLEDSSDPDVIAWIMAQRQRTESLLSALPLRDATEARLRELWVYPRRGLPIRRGNRVFQVHHDGIKSQGTWWVAEGDGEPRLLLDPNTWSNTGTIAVGAFEISPDGRYVAYIRHVAGSDWGTMYVLDVATGEHLADQIERVRWGGIAWLPDSSGFNYAWPPTDNPHQEWMRLHLLGNPVETDAVIFRSEIAPPSFAWADAFLDGQGAALYASQGTDRRTACWLIEPDGSTLRPVVPVYLAQFTLVHREGEIVYAVTDHLAPRKRLVAVDMANPAPADWITIVPETGAVLEQAAVVGGRWMLSLSQHGWTRFESRAFDGSDPKDVKLPGPGTGWFQQARPEDRTCFLQHGTLATPPNHYAVDPVTGLAEVVRLSEAKENLAGCVVSQVFVPARDGALIPLTLIHQPNLARDGTTPTWMYSYGGYSYASTHGFQFSVNEWVRAGGLYAIASIRGGGEEGEGWHQAAIGPNRQVAFNDFQDCAEWLIAEGYCSAKTLGISGGSNGGLLVSVCLLQRPDLFAAVIAEVGVTDMLRFHKFTVGAGWIPEYGSPDVADDFPHLLAYSPVHNVHADVSYPPVLIATSDHDDRVVPLHSYKFAAALQKTPSPLVLLRVEIDAGHGAGASTQLMQRRSADYHAFMWTALTGGFAGIVTG